MRTVPFLVLGRALKDLGTGSGDGASQFRQWVAGQVRQGARVGLPGRGLPGVLACRACVELAAAAARGARVQIPGLCQSGLAPAGHLLPLPLWLFMSLPLSWSETRMLPLM